eukprot:684437-Hanusia_phi.AAC.1
MQRVDAGECWEELAKRCEEETRSKEKAGRSGDDVLRRREWMFGRCEERRRNQRFMVESDARTLVEGRTTGTETLELLALEDIFHFTIVVPDG